MANRSRGYYREARKKAIKRKERIINSYRQDNPPAYPPDDFDPCRESSYGDCSPYWHVKHTGMLAKGKIHCSCQMCAFHGTPRQDIRNLEKMDSMLSDDGTSISYSGIPVLRNRIRRNIRGNYYPKSGFVGTKVGSKSKDSVEEFQEVIHHRKLENLVRTTINNQEVVYIDDVVDDSSLKNGRLYHLKKGNEFIYINRNGNLELHRFSHIAKNGLVLAEDNEFTYNPSCCREVYQISEKQM